MWFVVTERQFHRDVLRGVGECLEQDDCWPIASQPTLMPPACTSQAFASVPKECSGMITLVGAGDDDAGVVLAAMAMDVAVEAAAETVQDGDGVQTPRCSPAARLGSRTRTSSASRAGSGTEWCS